MLLLVQGLFSEEFLYTGFSKVTRFVRDLGSEVGLPTADSRKKLSLSVLPHPDTRTSAGTSSGVSPSSPRESEFEVLVNFLYACWAVFGLTPVKFLACSVAKEGNEWDSTICSIVFTGHCSCSFRSACCIVLGDSFCDNYGMNLVTSLCVQFGCSCCVL